MSQSPSHNPVNPDPPDKLDAAIAAAPEERDIVGEEAAEVISKACLSTRDRILVLGETAVLGSLKALFVTAFLQGMPEGVDEYEVVVFMDLIEGGGTGGEAFLALAEKIHFVELCLPNLRADFESGRFPRPPEFTWEKLEAVLLAKKAEGLLKAAKLESAQFFEVDEAGNLVLSDGTAGVPFATRRQNYFKARKEAHAAGFELFTEAEYRRLQSGERKYEVFWLSTWLESGENPSLAQDAYWGTDGFGVFERLPYEEYGIRGARRLARIPLKREA